MQKFSRDGYSSKIFSSVPSNEVSEVLVFGGFKGDSVSGWLEKNPRASVHAYEPVREYAAALEERFPASNVAVYAFGVGKRSGSRIFSIMGDATSEYVDANEKSSGPQETVDVKFKSVLAAGRNWPERIDIAEINIEGGEYELIAALAEAGYCSRMKHIFVQFHNVGKETDSLVTEARDRLRLTHSSVWCYEMVWEYWKLSESTS